MTLASCYELIDSTPLAILFLDAAGEVLHANPEVERLTGGLVTNAFEGNFLEAYLPRARLDGFERGSEFEIRTGERTCLLHARVNPCTAETHPAVAYIVTMEDRTEWARVYDERTRLMELATINEVLPTFLHELKNPLASIQALVELIIEDCGDGTLRDQLHSILVEIRRMKLGFDGLGSTSRNLRSNRNQAIDLAIREACAIFERQLENRRIRLVTGIETLPLLPLDSGGVRGILFNLLNNAKQACRPGDVIKVNARLGDGGRSFVFEVRDSGSGMPAEVLEQCTRMFFTTKRTGSGIGLALCRDAVDKVGGRLEIRSTSGEGTNIRVSLPIEPNQNPWRNG